MAEKRMFAKSIIDTDAFLSMPLSAQALYFHLCMRADDDGFVSNPRKIQRMICCSDDDLKLLIAKRYILVFDSGVIVIKHWRIHNYIRKDTYKETLYLEEKSSLFLKPDGAYTDHPLFEPSRTRDEHVNEPLTQYRLDKNRLDKDSIESSASAAPSHRSAFKPPTVEEVRAYCQERKNQVDPERFVDFYSAKGWMIGKNKVKDWKACVRTWEKREKEGNNRKSESAHKPTYDIEKYEKSGVFDDFGNLGKS
ncbi:replisome organizer [Caproiciproducens galactitolivorans]|uniref:Phage replication initiation protein n=1 Tax=Caproiciproducens galactitolivorans TaxID=642589 RepID=A0A4Z0XVK2_9FIRM|nr:replisome organizer [Caproiciproducens galactitolivorans]TGJ75364.1 hypothetical protein CAGA_24620 [Caproiciproducens galactitolivorans]